LIITIDTLRADRLDSYGCGQYLTPEMDRFAQRGVTFSKMITQIPLTGPAHTSLMTGRYAHAHGGVRNTVYLHDSIPTFAEILRGAGYTTAAFVSGWTLRSQMCRLDRGFDRYDDHMTNRYAMINSERLADETVAAVGTWLKQQHDQPVFLWVHFFDPHNPYRPHPEFSSLSATPPFSARQGGKKLLRYNEEVAFTDRQAARVLRDFITARPQSSHLTVITADHGESFGDHNYWGHGRQVYDSNLLVPLIIHWDRLPCAGQIETLPVQTVDLMPTLLAAAGQQIATPQSDGHNLMPLLLRVQPREQLLSRRLYFETYPGAAKMVPAGLKRQITARPSKAGLMEQDVKYIYTPRTGRLEIFNTADDPVERRSLPFPPKQIGDVRQTLETWYAQPGQSTTTGTQSELTAEDIEILEKLGYVE